jgi:hypothetical protein
MVSLKEAPGLTPHNDIENRLTLGVYLSLELKIITLQSLYYLAFKGIPSKSGLTF